MPASEIDETGNNIGTINQLKPMVLQCASELKVRLSRNEFPELAAALERYEAALNPGKRQNIQWGEVWGLGIILQNAASAAERRIAGRLLPALEDPAKTALDSLLSLFSALVTQLGAHLEAMTDEDLQRWLDERSRRLAPFRSFVISNEEPLRKIAASTSELKWMLRYIDFIVAKK